MRGALGEVMACSFLLLGGSVDKILLLILHDYLAILDEGVILEDVLVRRALPRVETGREAGIPRALRAGDLQ